MKTAHIVATNNVRQRVEQALKDELKAAGYQVTYLGSIATAEPSVVSGVLLLLFYDAMSEQLRTAASPITIN